MTDETRVKKSGMRRVVLPALLAIIALAAAGFFGVRAWRLAQEQARQDKIAEDQALAQAAIEDRWGIQITQVAATADGGLVDLRYRIVDPDKAIFLFDEVGNVPSLVDEDSGVEIALTTLPHRHDLEFGQTYFVIYRNVAGAIEPGNLVTVRVGDLSIRHFKVMS